MDKTKTLLIILIIIFLCGAGYFAFVKRKIETPASQKNQPEAKEEQNKSGGFSQADLEKIFDLAKKEKGTKIYYSEKLGVGFTYVMPKDYEVKIGENGDKINVNDQSVEVFSKDPKQTLEEAVKEKFLKSYNPKDCFVITNERNEQNLPNYVSAEISYPKPENSDDAWFENLKKCPRNYSQTNGMQYFLMNKDVPGKFIFVRIGQYSAASDGTPNNWTHSIRILK